VLWIVAREAVAASACGASCGILAGGWLSGTLIHLLYGIEPLDVFSFAAAALVMTGAVGVAASVPASRALRIAPTEALRCE
jgi:ABC-type antimicrobial peptide transport system permease subunit